MKTKLLPIIFCLFALSVFGQEKEARKFDEFGNISCDEYLARADGMIIEQANNLNSQIYVFIYEGKEKRPVYKKSKFVGYKSFLPQMRLAEVKIQSMKKYLESRKIRAENYVFINGGFRENFTIEIWVVPPGVEPPKPSPTLEKMKYRKGRPAGFCLWCCG